MVTRSKADLTRLRGGFNQLRSADERSVVAAYRWGEIVNELHNKGYSWEELGEEVDRSKYTVKLYAALFNRYDSEKQLIATARAMKTYDVSRLAGKSALVPIVYVYTCNNCFSTDVSRHKQDDDGNPVGTIAPVAFRAPSQS